MTNRNHRAFALGAALLLSLVMVSAQAGRARAEKKADAEPPPPRSFSFPIEASTPVEKLMPAVPRLPTKVALPAELAEVPEIAFEAELPNRATADDAIEHIGHNIAKIHHLNKTRTDGYLLALVGKRADLAGLPFVLGADCRQKEEQSRLFSQAVRVVRQLMEVKVSVSAADGEQASQRIAEQFWSGVREQSFDKSVKARAPDVMAANIAALMQVCGPQTVAMRLGLVKHLAETPHVEATRALARLAVFSAEEPVRRTAVHALKVRRERDYTDILRQGLRYPLPAVAKRTVEALVTLQRTDLTGDLVALLDEADPRAPHARAVDGKQVVVARELVKVNHHRNCLLCHAPGPLPRQTTSKEETKAKTPFEVPPGHRAVAVHVPLENIPGGSGALPTTRVDIILKKDGMNGKDFNKLLLENVLVLASDARTVRDPDSGEAKAVANVTLALPPDDALKASVVNHLGKPFAIFLHPVVGPADAMLPPGVRAPIPIPGTPMSSPSSPYESHVPDLFVRVDVTYLRQDFSALLAVADADPWPEMQRFDFLVRTRQLSDADAQTLRESIRKAGPSPYRQLAHDALCRLTSLDAEPTAEAWRRVLKQ